MSGEIREVTGKRLNRRLLLGGAGAAVAVPASGALLGGIASRASAQDDNQDLGESANEVIEKRELSPDDVTAALETYMPSGRMDEFLMFASGGHSGQVLVIGVPSMRLPQVDPSLHAGAMAGIWALQGHGGCCRR